MKVRALRIVSASLICLALLTTFSSSGAQVPASPAPPERLQLAASELLLPPPESHMAPLRQGALEPLPPGTGFIPPPMDLSHLTGQRMPKGIRAQALPNVWDWRTQGKVTPVEDQNPCGACYTFAALGNIESKLLMDGAGTFDFSQNNAKECNWHELNNFEYPPGTPWGSCDGGNYLLLASFFSQKGTVLEPCDPYVPSDVSCKSTCPYQKTLLDWRIISGSSVPNTEVLKQYIYDHGPVYTSMYADGTRGFDEWYDGSSTFNYTTSGDATNHAVLIVGWSDDLPPVPGGGTTPADGWIVKNSWGTSWGDNGYFYITYGSANIGMNSSFIHEWQDYDTNGDIMYYDEAGWGGYWGDNTTGWGLVKFTPDSNTNVARVEFWTTDSPTNVDVYLYDDFNGTTLSNKLAEVLNNPFSESGYHSVELSSPVPVTSGDDVIAVVKFTNASFDHPVPLDYFGPSETGRTYVSSDGSSWSEASKDVAIRLRTSTVVAEEPNVGIIKQVVGSDFEPGDPITFTLTIANNGNEVAASVVVTDDLPAEVLNPTFASTLNITPTGVFSYVWNVESLGEGESGTITIYGQIDPSLEENFSFANTATISDPEDDTSGNNTSSVTVMGGELKVYLPLVMRRYPPLPDAPVLNAISGGEDGNYTVDWEPAYLADTYILEEDDNASFSSPTERYSGSGTSWDASGKAVGTYYYHVKARNSWGDSGWSNIESVNVQPQTGPTPGFWEGSGVELYVTTDRAYVDDFAIYISVQGCGNYKITHTPQESINNDQFSFSGSFYASGTFGSATTASGITGLDDFFIPGCGSITGGPYSWDATWQNSSQPTSTPGEITRLDETKESTVTADKFYTVTRVK